ncbi:MAG: sugar phosphate isomerase/epimerase [Anaerolineae bacterium]|nr:sugar phosphate isomerase/epimerase [Anaerolineae bacterium]
MSAAINYSVFTKPWQTQSIEQVGELVSRLGFDGVELPVRPGYQVEPETIEEGLVAAAKRLAEYGVAIYSIAGPTSGPGIAGPSDEAAIAACAEAGVPIIRVMARVGKDESYLQAEERLQREYDALVPLLEKYGVTLGVQNHCGRHVANAVALKRIVERYDRRHIAAVWDAAHESLDGGDVDLALDAIWPHLCMVNLKNAIWQRTNGPEAEYARWRVYWTSGRQGLCVWPDVVAELKRRAYEGVACLTAEYSDAHAVERLIAEDIAFARTLFGAEEPRE